MAKMEIWKKERKVETIWDITPEVIEDEVTLTFVEYPEKYVVKIPKVEIEDFFKKLNEVI
jgi:hypothetical protein